MSGVQSVPVNFISSLFGLTSRRVQQLAQDGIIPKPNDGNYPLMASVKGYINFLQESSKRVGGDNEELIKARIRIDLAKAEEAELNLALRHGELIIADHVTDAINTMIANFKARILAIPSAVAANGTGLKKAELEELCQKLIYEALHELKSYNPEPSEPS